MPDTRASIAMEAVRIARRRRPWPQLVEAAGWKELDRRGIEWFDHTRSIVSGPDAERSDRLLRALAQVGAADPDAITTLVAALEPLLQRQLRRAKTSDYLGEVMSELFFVVADASARGELEVRTRLAQRLISRAHTRVHKREHRLRHRGTARPVVTSPYPPDSLPSDRYGTTPDVADLAVTRVGLQRFATAVASAVGSGALSSRGWSAFRDHRLRRAVVVAPLSSTAEREAARYATPVILRYATRHLADS